MGWGQKEKKGGKIRKMATVGREKKKEEREEEVKRVKLWEEERKQGSGD